MHHVSSRSQLRKRLFSHACQLCDKRFPTKSGLNRHAKLHSRGEDRSFACGQCDAMLASEASLRLHKRKVHENRLACEICDKRYSYANELKKHQYTHGGDRPFKCDQCDQCDDQEGFVTSNDMIRHKRIQHQGVRLVCDICQKTFTQNSHLNKHKQTIHNMNANNRSGESN